MASFSEVMLSFFFRQDTHVSRLTYRLRRRDIAYPRSKRMIPPANASAAIARPYQTVPLGETRPWYSR